MTPLTLYGYSCLCCGIRDDIGHQLEFYLKACCCLPLPASPYFPLPPFPLPTSNPRPSHKIFHPSSQRARHTCCLLDILDCSTL